MMSNMYAKRYVMVVSRIEKGIFENIEILSGIKIC